MDCYNLSIDEILEKLNTSKEVGLTEEKVQNIRKISGNNRGHLLLHVRPDRNVVFGHAGEIQRPAGFGRENDRPGGCQVGG